MNIIFDLLFRWFSVMIMFLGYVPMSLGETFQKASSSEDLKYVENRRQMVEIQIQGRDVKDARVLAAMKIVPRHLFVPKELQGQAYEDHPLPIGHRQTISQPYIVAKMTELAQVKKGDRVLEIGTGSGYQAAVLRELGADVFSVEIVKELSAWAQENLNAAGYSGVHLRVGDGYEGWPEHRPFDAIVVTAAPEKIPPPLIEQLKEGGRLVIPVGPVGVFQHQELLVVMKTKEGATHRTVFPVSFVPMTGKSQEAR